MLLGITLITFGMYAMTGFGGSDGFVGTAIWFIGGAMPWFGLVISIIGFRL
jgi:hypothetical protein